MSETTFSYHEDKDITPPADFRLHLGVSAVGRILSSFALVGVMSACGQASEAKSGEVIPYYVDTTSQYETDVGKAMSYTDDPKVHIALEKLQTTPIAQWLTDTSLAATSESIASTMFRSDQSDSMPVFVVYNIPNRDLKGESAGGFSTKNDYTEWINAISKSIGDGKSAVILEPDAVPNLIQLHGAEHEDRIELLRTALQIFKDNNKQSAVYLDVGHSDWLDVAQVGKLINTIDPDNNLVGGVSINVSNQRSQVETDAYADKIRQYTGRVNLKALIDNSMNGAADTNKIKEFCNPVGEKIGNLGDTDFDPSAPNEYTFVKEPGISDGQCGISKAKAGEFDGELLISQLTKD